MQLKNRTLIIPIILSLELVVGPLALNAMEPQNSLLTSTSMPAIDTPRTKLILRIIKQNPSDTCTVLCSYQALFEQDSSGKTVLLKGKGWRIERKSIDRIGAAKVSLDFINQQIAMILRYDLPTPEESAFTVQRHAENITLPLGWSCNKPLPDQRYISIETVNIFPKNAN